MTIRRIRRCATLKHETNKTLFAEKVRFTENGVRLAFGNEGLWASTFTEHSITLHGFLKFQRALSLLGSNLASVGVLRPTAVRAMGSLELGIDLGHDAVSAIGQLVDAPQLFGSCR